MKLHPHQGSFVCWWSCDLFTLRFSFSRQNSPSKHHQPAFGLYRKEWTCLFPCENNSSSFWPCTKLLALYSSIPRRSPHYRITHCHIFGPNVQPDTHLEAYIVDLKKACLTLGNILKKLSHSSYGADITTLLPIYRSTGWPKSASDLKMLSKNSLINLLGKFQQRLHSWSITINTQTNLQIISQYRIFCETCPTLIQNAILWNNAPTWFNNIFEPVCTKLYSGASKRSLRRCQTLKRSKELLKDSKLLTRSKMNRDQEDRILSRTTIELN